MSAFRGGKANEGDDSDSDGPPAVATGLARPRPRAQVSFRLPRGDSGQKIEDPRLSQSDPVCSFTSSGAAASSPYDYEAPRNRRRLFRDMSFTAKPIRRDDLKRNGGGGFRKAPQFLSPEGLFSPGSSSGHDKNYSSSTQASSGGDHDPGKESGAAMRRQASFRGKHRRGESGTPGGRRARMRNYFKERSRNYMHQNNSGSDGRSSQPVNQYHIPPPEETNFSILEAMIHLYSMAFGDVAMWVYGASFGKVLLFFLTFYMILVYCFVLLLYLVDKLYTSSACIHVPEEGELSARAHVEFAFELSWTTFTTVGYGNVGPSSEVGCYPIRLINSTEAILGMVFVSMCSGLFYAKLLRLLGRAPVTFSSTLCVQYGQGLEANKKSSLTNDAKFYSRGETMPRRQSLRDEEAFHPFPIIEFRIVNNRANYEPGKNEIWDAEVTAIVQLSLENDPHENSEGLDDFQINRSSRWLPPVASKVNDDADDKKRQQVFYKLALKPSSHPYFSRVWFLRHTLDATSPLMRREVRSAIRGRSDGWDPSMNNYLDIRECLVEFTSLQIIMSGASALSRSEVYAEKTYSYEDICVGWRYIAVCYEEDTGRQRWETCRKRLKRKHISYGDDAATRVDLSLIHDIVPQRGNDFEPVDD